VQTWADDDAWREPTNHTSRRLDDGLIADRGGRLLRDYARLLFISAAPFRTGLPGQLAMDSPSDCSLSEVPPPTAGHVPCVITGHADEGQIAGSNGCTWVTFDDSNERRELRWPPGYSAQFDPLIVYDPQGAVVARGGDLVLGDGWEPSADVSGPCGGAVTDVYSMHPRSPGP
jgi:hypothetical protein